MYSTALTIATPGTSAEEQRALFTQARLVSLYEAFAVIPDPRSRHGLRYDLPSLLTCLVAALLSNCNSTEAVGQWCRDQEALLRAYFGPRDFYTLTGSLYRQLLPRLDAQAIKVVLAAQVLSSRQYRLGDGDLIGFLVHAHLPERFLAVLGTRSASRWGAVCSPGLAPRTVFPSSASGSSAGTVVVAWTQLPSTRWVAQASNCGTSQRYSEPTSGKKQSGTKHGSQQGAMIATPLRDRLGSIAVARASRRPNR